MNTTDSAVRITHVPTGIVVSCQNEKSQLQNREQAMRILRARLLAAAQEQADAAASDARKAQVRTVDRSERIRTYNFPQNRITDHRIGYTAYNLDLALAGELDGVLDALGRGGPGGPAGRRRGTGPPLTAVTARLQALRGRRLGAQHLPVGHLEGGAERVPRPRPPAPSTSAKPMLTPTGVPGTRDSQSSVRTAASIRRATSAASVIPAPGSTTTNSSPP